MNKRAAVSRRAVLAIVISLLVPSCTPDSPGAETLRAFEVGAPAADVLEALPPGGIETPPDERAVLVLEGYWRDRFLIEGSSIEILWVHDPTLGFPDGDLRDGVTPVVFVDDRLDGWGWTYFDERREEWGLGDRPTGVPLPPPLEGVEEAV